MPETCADLRHEPLLRRDFTFAKPAFPDRERPRSGVLLTGANSYIALHVLRELLDAWPGPIHCLLRARDPDHARERLREGGLAWGLSFPDLDRVRLHPGDVTEAGWRLPPGERALLDEEVDTVIHLSLQARYDLSWATYRDVWFPELVRMVEWCGGARPKSLHYPGSYNTHFLQDDGDFQSLGRSAWTSGYTAFKWTAEQVIRRAVGGNLSASYYDIPLVLGTAARGLCPRTYSAVLVINAFLQARAGIDVGQLRVVPVDVLARVMVENARQPAERMLAFVRPVLGRPITFDDVAAELRDLGRPLRKTDRQEFVGLRPELRRFVKFFLPEDMADLITRTHVHPAIFPPSFDVSALPDALSVLRANCREIYGAGA